MGHGTNKKSLHNQINDSSYIKEMNATIGKVYDFVDMPFLDIRSSGKNLDKNILDLLREARSSESNAICKARELQKVLSDSRTEKDEIWADSLIAMADYDQLKLSLEEAREHNKALLRENKALHQFLKLAQDRLVELEDSKLQVSEDIWEAPDYEMMIDVMKQEAQRKIKRCNDEKKSMENLIKDYEEDKDKAMAAAEQATRVASRLESVISCCANCKERNAKMILEKTEKRASITSLALSIRGEPHQLEDCTMPPARRLSSVLAGLGNIRRSSITTPCNQEERDTKMIDSNSVIPESVKNDSHQPRDSKKTGMRKINTWHGGLSTGSKCYDVNFSMGKNKDTWISSEFERSNIFKSTSGLEVESNMNRADISLQEKSQVKSKPLKHPSRAQNNSGINCSWHGNPRVSATKLGNILQTSSQPDTHADQEIFAVLSSKSRNNLFFQKKVPRSSNKTLANADFDKNKTWHGFHRNHDAQFPASLTDCSEITDSDASISNIPQRAAQATRRTDTNLRLDLSTGPNADDMPLHTTKVRHVSRSWFGHRS